MLDNRILFFCHLLNEYEPGNDCSGCIMNSLYICKLFGDWGGCIGDPYVHHA